MARTRFGDLAKAAGHRLELQVLHSAAGFYLGTQNAEGPVSRESEEYWPTPKAAADALDNGDWNQRLQP